jgi:hypothetical protein
MSSELDLQEVDGRVQSRRRADDRVAPLAQLEVAAPIIHVWIEVNVEVNAASLSAGRY